MSRGVFQLFKQFCIMAELRNCIQFLSSDICVELRENRVTGRILPLKSWPLKPHEAAMHATDDDDGGSAFMTYELFVQPVHMTDSDHCLAAGGKLIGDTEL